MILFKRTVCVACCVYSFVGIMCSQDLLDYSNSLKYANYLFKTHQYDLAVGEFERVIFLEPTDTLSKVKLIKSYRYLNNSKFALIRIDKFFPDDRIHMPAAFSIEYVKNLIYENQYTQASGFLELNTTIEPTVKADYQLGILLIQNRWEEANHFADYMKSVHAESKSYNELCGILTDGVNARYKSPFVAGSISAVFPGGGKIYCGYLIDAIYSFLFVSGSTWLTYRSFQRNGNSTNTLLLGSLACCLYVANIYGSSKSAKRYNHAKNQIFKNRTEGALLND